tara:strand:+ start:60 stop:281 length:222 start_codon:yes stop_codon:yes gene_type:complete
MVEKTYIRYLLNLNTISAKNESSMETKKNLVQMLNKKEELSNDDYWTLYEIERNWTIISAEIKMEIKRIPDET